MIEMAKYTRIFIALAVLAVATSVARTQTSCDDVTCGTGQVCEIRARCVQPTNPCAYVHCARGLKCCVRPRGVVCTVSCDGNLEIPH